VPDEDAASDAPDAVDAPDAPDAVTGLWREYRRGADPSVRERLILHYAPLVKYVAGRVGAGLPQRVEQSDLVSYGIFGLIDAIDKFEPERGFKFETYATARIRGAIIDELRAVDWIPRSVRAKARAVEQAYAKLEHELRRTPEDAEVAAELGMSPDEFDAVLARISFTGIVALDEVLSAGGDDGDSATTVADTIADDTHDPEARFEDDEMRRLLADALHHVSERERLVLTLYYFDGMTLAEIGGVLGVTESRVCQIHTKAILRLRTRLRAAID